MTSFTVTKMAAADLLGIARYTQKQWGREQRDLYLTLLDASFRQLAANPSKGQECNEIREGYWKFRVGSHVIFYRQTLPDTIEIVRVLHGRMDIATRLSSS